MKRGLVKFAPAETPASTFEARLEALRSNLLENGASMGLIYGDVSRSSGIDYLTNFCLYWNEAVMAVPVDGPPALIMKLSKRVQPWILKTSILEDIRSGPRIVENIAEFIKERTREGTVRVALNDLEWWPNTLLSALKSTLTECDFIDMPGAIRNLRSIPDKEELALTREAGRLLAKAVEKAWTIGTNVDQRTEIVVREARLAGFLDVEVTCKQLSDGTEYIDAIGQYRYIWVRTSRPRNGELGEVARDMLERVRHELKPGATELALAEILSSGIQGKFRQNFSCLEQTEIETRGGFKKAEFSDRPFQEGEILSLVLALSGDKEVVVAADTLQVGRASAESLIF